MFFFGKIDKNWPLCSTARFDRKVQCDCNPENQVDSILK